jgi:putative DNA methylase
MADDKRLIEDYLPIVAISASASKEKNVRKGHISTLHLWWARRPLVACRAAVYGALVPASRFVPNNGSNEKKKSLGRANSAKFVKALCLYPGEPRTIQEAQRHILAAHADRLTQEVADWKAGNMPKPGWVEEFKFSGTKVTMEDITAGSAPRPRVLDMFAGGGAIPLEALRLGCEAYALDLNPVAHIVQLCTLVYPQKYGNPDTTARGMTGPKNKKGEATWGGLAEEVGYWGKWVLKKVGAEIGDLYPLIPDPQYRGKKPAIQSNWLKEHDAEEVPAGYLMPVAYLWTRTVKCKNPACGAIVPLVKQTWLCKKENQYVAMKMIAPKGKKEVRFEVIEARSEKGLGFDPAAFSKAGNATCPFCGTVADIGYVKSEGWSGRMNQQLMSIVCTQVGKMGKTYLSATDYEEFVPDERTLRSRIDSFCSNTHLSEPAEPIAGLSKDCQDNSLGITVRPYGIRTWGDAFTPRQRFSLLSFCHAITEAENNMQSLGHSPDSGKAVATALACVLDKQADFNSAHCVLKADGGRGIVHTFGRQALAMVWDFAEANPFNDQIACWTGSLKEVLGNLEDLRLDRAATVIRGSALELPMASGSLDAVITDPPYYDNVPYADISDFFFVWLKRSIGKLYPEHFATSLTPKRQEAIADPGRHGGDRVKAKQAYEQMMLRAFQEAYRVLKSGGQMTTVYAHKTTLGWSTLVEALRKAGFSVTEAWPLDTETSGRLRAQDSSALASSIFLIARKRDESSKAGNYETDVVPELGGIVRERVDTLWEMGISGADLVIACVGAGLRAFTKYARVEYGNGEEVPAERFLAEVETVVLETILGKLSKTVGSKSGQTSLAGLDPATRFYVLWRYTYGAAELDAGEAIIFANGTHVELDGPHSLTQGTRALLEKRKSKYRLHDYTERGDENALGQPAEDGTSAPAVDALHRLLWLLEHRPRKVPEFLNEAKPNIEQLRLVAQALGGPALSGGELSDVSSTAEQSALGKLLANWSAVMVGKAAVEDRRTGQERLFKE